jgi:hypothetical protein
VRVGARIKGPLSDDRIQIIEAKVSAVVAQIAKNFAALDRSMHSAKLSLAELASELAALDRYERRALSRRKFAIRQFDLVRLEAERAPAPRERRAPAGWGKPIETAIEPRAAATLSYTKPSGHDSVYL